MEIEHLGLDVRLLALRNFAFAIEVPDWLSESASDVGAFALESVPDVVGGNDVRFAARFGLVNTEESDKVGVVDVEELARVGAVDADFVNLGGVVAEVFDVAEDVAVAILGNEVTEGGLVRVGDGREGWEEDDEPEVGADSHIGGARLFDAPFLDREAFEEDEAIAVDQVILEFGEEGDEVGGEREVLLYSPVYQFLYPPRIYLPKRIGSIPW